MTAHTSGRLDAPRLEPTPGPAHEAPELLHLDDAVDGEANRLGVGTGAESLPRLVNRLRVDEEGLARVAKASHGRLPHRHMLGHRQAYVKPPCFSGTGRHPRRRRGPAWP